MDTNVQVLTFALSKFGHRHATKIQNNMCPFDYLKGFMFYIVLFKG
jgi:hypothetical protein